MGRWGLAVVRGRSMLPTLTDGDRLLVRHGDSPRTGGLAVVRLPSGADGGSTAEVVAVKRVVARQSEGWWVERDNPREGVDSWSVGAVPANRVVARVLCRVWPRPSLLRQGHLDSRRTGHGCADRVEHHVRRLRRLLLR